MMQPLQNSLLCSSQPINLQEEFDKIYSIVSKLAGKE
jgi:hypothetical protein